MGLSRVGQGWATLGKDELSRVGQGGAPNKAGHSGPPADPHEALRAAEGTG